MICPRCGAQNMDGVSFCVSCGAQLPSHTPITPEVPQQNVSYGQQQQYQQPQYQQPQQPPPYGSGSTSSYGNQSNNDMFAPKNYQTEAIIVTIISLLCCCSPISVILGIIAIIKANAVNTEFANGNYQAAKNNADAAKKLTIWAAIIAVAFAVIVPILYVLIFSATIAELGGWQEFINSLN